MPVHTNQFTLIGDDSSPRTNQLIETRCTCMSAQHYKTKVSLTIKCYPGHTIRALGKVALREVQSEHPKLIIFAAGICDVTSKEAARNYTEVYRYHRRKRIPMSRPNPRSHIA
jgi:hypothetical protein